MEKEKINTEINTDERKRFIKAPEKILLIFYRITIGEARCNSNNGAARWNFSSIKKILFGISKRNGIFQNKPKLALNYH